ncbi:MAG: radical SAM protein [Proteobacteria bacterium]|nr:radical SAM protein [Pseudomonadota bacterium]
MRVLFVQPPHDPNSFAHKSGLAEPLVYEILASTIPHHDTRIFDMRIGEASLEEEIETYSPNVIGVGCVTAGYRECVRVLKRIKTINSSIITIVGGHHPTVMPQDFSNDFTDFIVLGEGEQTFRELVDVLELRGSVSHVKGLVIPNDRNLHFTGERPLIDINDIPIPRRDLTEKHRKNYFRGNWRPIVSIVGSRGCSYRCKFCCQWVLYRGTYRVRSPKNVVSELSQIDEKYIDFIDDNSWENTRWMEELYVRIKEAGIRKNYKLYTRSDLVIRRPDLVERWRTIGLRAVLIGFESFRDEDLLTLNKKNTVAKNIEASRILKENDIDIIGYFLIDPSYTEEDFRSLIDHVRRLDIEQPIFSVLTPFPGTQLFDEVKERIITRNYQYFDGMHAVVPSALPAEEFYRSYKELYRECYPKGKLIKKFLQGKIRFTLPQALAQKRYLKNLGPAEP